MHYTLASTGAAALLSLLSLTSALPTSSTTEKRTPVDLAPRCGTTVYPSYISYVDSSISNTAVGPQYSVSASSQPLGPWRVAQVQFSLPAGITNGPCELRYGFPSSASITVTGTKSPPQLQVQKSLGAFSPADTWNTKPGVGSLYGTVKPEPNQAASVNSETCAATLSYYVQTFEQWELSGGSAPNSGVEFAQQDGVQGFYLTYGC
ncbi:MAG: hypothetical protein M1833_002060 [Piccolia ochrophora]|nr:MAG: hypothetical protein M1833_002060 [Piccolia ochrophora]